MQQVSIVRYRTAYDPLHFRGTTNPRGLSSIPSPDTDLHVLPNLRYNGAPELKLLLAPARPMVSLP